MFWLVSPHSPDRFTFHTLHPGEEDGGVDRGEGRWGEERTRKRGKRVIL
jgi:hypothetical protein